MRHSLLHKLVLAALSVTLILGAGAVLGKDAPGFVDLSFIDVPENATEVQDITLGPVLKDVVRDARANDDLEIAELLSMVHNLHMVSFSLDDQQSTSLAAEAVARISKQLKDEDWDRLIRVKDGDEITSIHVKYHDDDMVGLTVVVFSPDDEALFVNVQGDLDLGKLMRLAGDLDEDQLEAYLEKFDADIHVE